mmetsp:Transcript_17838/g.30757  ORF Transcript_17838/g.30757 Transcript_17838/m.30757 type:complete len:335 (-) Transcript_17838:477-1481(-)
MSVCEGKTLPGTDDRNRVREKFFDYLKKYNAGDRDNLLHFARNSEEKIFAVSKSQKEYVQKCLAFIFSLKKQTVVNANQAAQQAQQGSGPPGGRMKQPPQDKKKRTWHTETGGAQWEHMDQMNDVFGDDPHLGKAAEAPAEGAAGQAAEAPAEETNNANEVEAASSPVPPSSSSSMPPSSARTATSASDIGCDKSKRKKRRVEKDPDTGRKKKKEGGTDLHVLMRYIDKKMEEDRAERERERLERRLEKEKERERREKEKEAERERKEKERQRLEEERRQRERERDLRDFQVRARIIAEMFGRLTAMAAVSTARDKPTETAKKPEEGGSANHPE